MLIRKRLVDRRADAELDETAQAIAADRGVSLATAVQLALDEDPALALRFADLDRSPFLELAVAADEAVTGGRAPTFAAAVALVLCEDDTLAKRVHAQFEDTAT
jgi:hypothetical protein